MLKTCTGPTCRGRTWPTSYFAKNAKKPDGLANLCKRCAKDASRKHYLKHREAVKRKARGHNRAQTERLREIINDAKAKPCTDCGVAYPPHVMDFDHLDGSEKRFNVADAVSHGYSDETIRDELAKCELVCANCHRERTHRRKLERRAAECVPTNDNAPVVPAEPQPVKVQLDIFGMLA